MKTEKCSTCQGKGYVSQPIPGGTLHKSCPQCGGRDLTPWEKVQKHLTPEILAEFFEEICYNSSNCNHECPLFRVCKEIPLSSIHLFPHKEDFLEWLNKSSQ